jgi:outer membrane protein TolC
VVEDLINHAVTKRADVLVARAAVEAAKAQYGLARANLVPDPTVTGFYAHATAITNPIDPAPRWDSLGIQVQIAIPFSNLNSGAPGRLLHGVAVRAAT